MAGFDVGEAAFAGFGLLRRSPLAVVVWGVLGAGFVALVLLLFGGVVVSSIAALVAAAGSGAGQGAASTSAAFAAVGGLLGFFLVLMIGVWALGAVISCAVFRAVLEPESSSYFYLRFGTRELWVMLLAFVQGLLLSLAQLVMGIPLGVVTVLAAGSHASSGVVLAIGALGRLPVLGVTFWLYLRFSLTAPMTFTDRRLRLFECWSVTRGHVLKLLGVGLLIGLVSMVVYFILMTVAIVGGVATVGKFVADGRLRPEVLHLSPSAWIAALTPAAGLVVGLVALGATVLTPITIAPWAWIYQRLNPKEDIATVFA